MRGDLSPQSKCLLGFVLCFIQVFLPILSLNLDLTFPGSKGLYYDIIFKHPSDFSMLINLDQMYDPVNHIWHLGVTLACSISANKILPQGKTSLSAKLFFSVSPQILTNMHCVFVCGCVCACFYFPASCTPAQCEGQGTARPAAGDVTPGQATAAMHKIASTDHRPPPICCDSRLGRGCRRLNFSGREQIAPRWAFQH